jgi:hypothetical protein
MTRRKKRLYLGVMILSGLALFVDRFILSESVMVPDPAIGSPAEPAGRHAGAVSTATEDALSIPELPFPRGVEHFTFGSEIPDLFAPPTAASDENAARPGGSDNDPLATDARQSKGAGRAAFLTDHELGGLLTHERLRIAIVDGRWLRLGDEVDGCTLTRISGKEAVFDCYDGEAVLKPARRSHGP